MKAKRPTLPLGVDIDGTRLHVARSEFAADGKPKLVAVASRECANDPAAALRDAVRELATAERRCVMGIAHPDAFLRVVTMPKMSRFERSKAAAFQASRYIDYPIAEAAISLTPLDANARWTLGIARKTALQSRITTAKRAKLTPLAVDDVAFALARVHANAEGAIDISDDMTRLTIFAQPIPYVADVMLGSTSLVEGIARSLGIDAGAAEERMRSVGFGGAGEAQRDALIDGISDMLAHARASGHTEIRRLITIGRGGRVPGLAEAIERATGYGVRIATLEVDVSDTLPPDVLRAAGADWSVAYGLSLWDVAS